MEEKIKLLELRKVRKEKKMSRDDLAKLSGVNKFTISKLERGENNAKNIKLSTLIALATALKTKARNIVPKDIAKRL